jgi:hypothetical protein
MTYQAPVKHPVENRQPQIIQNAHEIDNNVNVNNLGQGQHQGQGQEQELYSNQANEQNNTTKVDLSTFNVTQDNTTTFFNGSSLPTSTFNLYSTSDLSNDHKVGFNISIPLGSNRKTVIKDLELSREALVAEMCANLASANLTNAMCEESFYTLVDYEVLPTPPSVELDSAKQSIKDALASIKELQRTNEALQLRLIQMQNTPTISNIQG